MLAHDTLSPPDDEPILRRPPAPMLPAAVGLMAGIVLDYVAASAWAGDGPPWFAGAGVAAIGVAWAAWCASAARKRDGTPRARHAQAGGKAVARRAGPAAMLCAILLAMAGLGAMRHALATRYVPADHIVHHAADEPAIVTITGRVISRPRIVEPDDAMPRAFPLSPRTVFLIEAEAIAGEPVARDHAGENNANGGEEGAGGDAVAARGNATGAGGGAMAVGRGATGTGGVNIPVSGRVAIQVKEPVFPLAVGERVRIAGWLRRPGPPANPGGFDWARHLRGDRVFAALSTDHAAAVTRLSPRATASSSGEPPDAPAGERLSTDDTSATQRLTASSSGTRTGAALLDRLRDRLRGYLLAGALDENDEAAGVVSAMVLAQRGDVEKRLNDVFVQTGNAHFLAASGMQIVWLWMLVWLVLRAAGLPYRATAIAIALVIVAYVLVAESEPSILRAGIVGLLACGALYRRMLTNTVNWLACAAFLVLLIDPPDLFRPAFQLSFLAVLGLMHISPRIAARLARLPLIERIEHAPFLPLARTPYDPAGAAGLPSRFRLVAAWSTQTARLAISVALGAWLATLPACCYHFDQCTPLGWLGTLLLSLPVFVVTAVGYLKVVLGAILPSSALLTGPLLAVTSEALVRVVRLLTHIPGMVFDGRLPSLAWTLAVYGWMAIVLYGPRVAPRLNRLPRAATAGVAAALVLWWAIPPRWAQRERDALIVWMLAVGNGTATLIELPDGRAMLYDCGTRSAFDAGRVVVELLRLRGIREIDAAFLSHTDFDHYSGLATVARQRPIRRLFINDHFERHVEPPSPAAALLEELRNAGTQIITTSGSRRFDAGKGVNMTALWPPAAVEQGTPGENDASTVLRLEHRGHAILLTGDIAEWAIGRLLADAPALGCDVLALPHHGSVVHNTASFIDATGAAWAIRSSGQRDAITTNGIDELAGRGRTYLNTADAGCVRIRIAADGLTVDAAR